VPPGELGQAEVKARLMAEAVALGGIDAMLPGAGDLAFGLPFVEELARKHALPYVAANLSCDGRRPFEDALRVQRDGRAFLFVGVVGDTVDAPGCKATDAAPAVRSALAEAGTDDVVVVLSGQRGLADERLAADVPRIDFVVNGQDRDQRFTPDALSSGALRLAAGSRGKHLGVLSLTWADVGASGSASGGTARWRDVGAGAAAEEKRARLERRIAELSAKRDEAADGDAQARLDRQLAFYRKEQQDALDAAASAAEGVGGNTVRNELRELSAAVADHAATAALVARAKAEIATGAAHPSTSPATLGVSAPGARSGASAFAGSAACAGCHVAETVQWQSTAHAHAYAALKTVGRARDQECYACHVTGAHHPDGPKSPDAVAGLEDVGCESCHGAGRAHAADPKVPMAHARPGVEVCTSCHDGVRDEGRFDPATYLEKVKHGSR
jgi:hypothetical protein